MWRLASCATELARHVREHHDRELEALRLVPGHQADAITALLETGASGGLAAVGGLAQRVHEPSERDAPICLVLPGELHHLQHVREHALAGRTHDEPHVRARVLEQPSNRLRRRPVISPRVQRAQQHQRVGDRLRGVGSPAGTSNGWNRRRGCGCRSSSSVSSPTANSAPRSVAYTFNASSGHSIAASAARSVSTSSRSWKDRPPTSRWGTHAPRGRQVATGDVVGELDEAAEEDADVPRLDRHELGAPFRRSETFQWLSSSSHWIQAPTASGSEASMAGMVTFLFPYRSGTGRAIMAGWRTSPADAGSGLRTPGSGPCRGSGGQTRPGAWSLEPGAFLLVPEPEPLPERGKRNVVGLQ